MAETNQSKTDQLTLYRFVSLRSPELSTSEDQKRHFVFYEDLPESDYVKSLKSNPPLTLPASFIPFQNEVDIKEIVGESFFNFSTWLANEKVNLKPNDIVEKINLANVTKLEKDIEVRLWDNLFYQVKEAETFLTKENILETLVAQNLLKQKVKIGFEGNSLLELADAQVVLPVNLFGSNELALYKHLNLETEPKQGFVPKGYGYFSLGIADYNKVVSEVCCYKQGEIAHIENVMAKEIREKITTKVHTSEITQTDSTETETEKLSDNVSTDRFQMQTEIASILNEQKQFSVNTHINQSWGSGSFDLSASYANNTSKEESSKQAVTKGKDITNRAMERIVSRVKSEKKVNITDTFTEVNKHGYDNTNGNENICGIYRNVNSIYKNQIQNYGKRLMFEFSVPQPSKLHRLALEASDSNALGSFLKKPKDPHVEIKDFTEINENNFQTLAAKYDANVRMFPKDVLVSHGIVQSSDRWDSAFAQQFDVKVPNDFYTKEYAISYSGVADSAHIGSGQMIDVTIGNSHKRINLTNAFCEGKDDNVALMPYTNEIKIATWILNCISVNVIVTLFCSPTEDCINLWKMETYKAIISGYEEKLREYNENQSQANANQQQNLESNPLYFRQIEQLTLRKSCISYLIDDTDTSSKQKFGLKMYDGDKLNDVHIKTNKELDNYSSFIKFIEQAFEWDLMSYSFYPFYWGERKDWGELYNYDCNDPLFKSFMQAGMARVVVTVRPGFAEAVMFYLKTGKIWNGGKVPIIGHQLYLSIVDELKKEPYTVKETWETVVPTNLIALQKDNVLPCSCEEDKSNNLVLPNLLHA